MSKSLPGRDRPETKDPKAFTCEGWGEEGGEEGCEGEGERATVREMCVILEYVKCRVGEREK
jgi:hypothetical protein